MENPVITGFSGPLKSFPLNGAGGLWRQVVADAVDARDFAGDALGDVLEQGEGHIPVSYTHLHLFDIFCCRCCDIINHAHCS